MIPLMKPAYASMLILQATTEWNDFLWPLVVTDDDVSGTFTFLRSLPDHGNDPNLTPEQIGNTWLNYLIERRTILWWGGIGNSTEHTAYLRLKSGIPAPVSGSIEPGSAARKAGSPLLRARSRKRSVRRSDMLATSAATMARKSST